jgi:hypothetical protein
MADQNITIRMPDGTPAYFPSGTPNDMLVQAVTDYNKAQQKEPLVPSHQQQQQGTPLVSAHAPQPQESLLDKTRGVIHSGLGLIGEALQAGPAERLKKTHPEIKILGDTSDEKSFFPPAQYNEGATPGQRIINVGKFAYNNLINPLGTPSGFLGSAVSSRPGVEVLPPEKVAAGLNVGRIPRGYLAREAGPTGAAQIAPHELPAGQQFQPRGLLEGGTVNAENAGPRFIAPNRGPAMSPEEAALMERPANSIAVNRTVRPEGVELPTRTSRGSLIRPEVSPFSTLGGFRETGTPPSGPYPLNVVPHQVLPRQAQTVQTGLAPNRAVLDAIAGQPPSQIIPPGAEIPRSPGVNAYPNRIAANPITRPYEPEPSGLTQEELAARDAAIKRLSNRPSEQLGAANPTAKEPPPSQVLWENTGTQAPEQPGDFYPSGFTKTYTRPEATPFQPAVAPTFEGNLKSFAQWVNWHRAAPLGGKIEGAKFEDLRASGMDAVKAFESGNRTGRLADVANWFDEMYKKIRAAGIDINYQEDYLQHIWDNTPEEIATKLQNIRVPENAPFTKERFFNTYEQGIAAGLTPKYTTIPDIVRSYKAAVDRAVANKKFYDYLRATGQLAKGSSITPKEWARSSMGPFKEQIFGLLKNHFEEVPSWVRKIGDTVSGMKNLYLGGGLPGTDINMHKWNITQRAFMSRGMKGLGDSIKSTFVPSAYKQFVMEHIEDAYDMVKHGLTFDIEDHSLFSRAPNELEKSLNSTVIGRQVSRVMKGVRSVWEEPLFGGVDRIGSLPAMKLKDALSVRDRLIAGGMDATEAKQLASEYTNTLYGGVNRAARGWSKSKWEAARISLLAPDWLLTNVEIAQKAFQALRGTADPLYLRAFVRGLGPKVATKIIKYGIAGGIAEKVWDINNPNRSEDIPVGYDAKGRTRNFSPLGTSFEAVRLPEQLATGTAGGNLGMLFEQIRNRMSLPLGNAMNLVKNVDAFGRPLYGKNTYGKPIPAWKQAAGISQQFAGPFQPQIAQGLINYSLGDISLEQALSAGLELPFRYRYEEKKK